MSFYLRPYTLSFEHISHGGNMRKIKGLILILLSLQAFSATEKLQLTTEVLKFDKTQQKVQGQVTSERNFVEQKDSQEQSFDKIHFHNKCYETIQAALIFKNLYGDWETAGWYTLAPGQRGYIEDTRNTVYYTYAESSNMRWSGSDTYEYVNGYGPYGFTKRQITTDAWGNWTHNFTCN